MAFLGVRYSISLLGSYRIASHRIDAELNIAIKSGRDRNGEVVRASGVPL